MTSHAARQRTTFGLVLLLSVSSRVAASEARDPTPRTDAALPAGLVPASASRFGQSAGEVIGQDVRSAGGEDLGEISDLVIDTNTGRIAYALVSDGGLAGLGDTLRPVPFPAFRGTRAEHGALVVDLNSADWSAAPSVRKDYLAQLTADRRGRAIYDYYGRDADDLADSSSNANPSFVGPLMSAKDIVGMKVRNGDRHVGNVEDVLLDPASRTASILLDPDDDFVGTDAKFVIKFSQLARGALDDDALATSLIPKDFDDARSATAGVPPGEYVYPYRWTGYAFVWNTMGDPTSHIDAARHTVSGTANATPASPPRPSIGTIRDTLRSHGDLPPAARAVNLLLEGETVVIEGSVTSEATLLRVGEIVDRAAGGRPVENRLKIVAAE